MKTVPLSQAKDQLSRYVEMARRGVPVRIIVRGRPAAELVPVAAPRTGKGRRTADEAWLDELERSGIIRRGRGGVDPALMKPGPRGRGEPISETVLRMRREGW